MHLRRIRYVAKLSTPSHPCELVYVGGQRCGQRAFHRAGTHWYCKRHLAGVKAGTTRSATGVMATPEGYQISIGRERRRPGVDKRRRLTEDQERVRRKRQATKQHRDGVGRFS